ncbi:DUF86 domain-containing protein [Viridibacterium curvum]|uniref:DUF86 domain-containing protein n=1 Tax=Viridibacterium curvum TaxID=1101404 RepID=A0ABP9QRC6_9RHOO
MNASRRNENLYLADIVQAAREIETYTTLSKEDFLADRMRQRAVIQCFEVIGEASKKLAPEFRGENAHIPWRYMAAFRDKLIHDYFEVDLQLVWATARQEIPALIVQLEQLAQRLGE